MSTVKWTAIMQDKVYCYRIKVINIDDSVSWEEHTVNEIDSRFGEAMACGKVVSFYEELREAKKIKDYHIVY